MTDPCRAASKPMTAEFTQDDALEVWNLAVHANITTPDEPYPASAEAAAAVIQQACGAKLAEVRAERDAVWKAILDDQRLQWAAAIQDKLDTQSRTIAEQAAEIERLRAFARSYVTAWESATGTVYLIEDARAALEGSTPSSLVQEQSAIAAAPVRYGCHVDLADDEEPDGCVIEYGAHGDCIHATFANGRLRRKPHTCPHWKPVHGSDVEGSTPSSVAKGEREWIG